MLYRKYSPSELLSQCEECYFIWDSEGPMEEAITIESPPNGFCSIVFNYGDSYYLQNKKYEKFKVPKQFISGQNIYSYKLFLQGTIGITGIVFKPAALATIFQIPIYEYTEERIDLYKVFKKKVIDQYVQQVSDASSEDQRIKLLEEFIMEQYRLQKPEPDYIDQAANYIVEKN
jgi:hypothetical protein